MAFIERMRQAIISGQKQQVEFFRKKSEAEDDAKRKHEVRSAWLNSEEHRNPYGWLDRCVIDVLEEVGRVTWGEGMFTIRKGQKTKSGFVACNMKPSDVIWSDIKQLEWRVESRFVPSVRGRGFEQWYEINFAKGFLGDSLRIRFLDGFLSFAVHRSTFQEKFEYAFVQAAEKGGPITHFFDYDSYYANQPAVKGYISRQDRG